MSVLKLAARPSPKLIMIPGLIAVIALGIAAYYYFPNPVDWTISYRPAALALISGASPYAGRPFFNAPWILIPLIPFALMPYRVGVAALFVANLALFLYISWRMAAKPVAVTAFICSLPVVIALLFGQVDSLILLGLFLPRPLGLVLLLAKPQIGAVIALFWAVEIWRESGWKQVIKTFAPVAGLFLISFLIYGLWPLTSNPGSLISTDHNTSLWPGSLMIGLPLIVYALRSRREDFARMAAPFFSPYVSPQSWSVALLGLMHNEFEMVAACLASWAMLLFRVVH
jgi:hypothetical protein